MAGLPTVEVQKKGVGRVRVNQSDLEAYENDGYSVVEGTEDDGRPAGVNDAGEVVAVEEEVEIDLSKAKEAELQSIIDEHDLDVDLSEYSKIGEKRDAVADALEG
jgi:hypothetical protein